MRINFLTNEQLIKLLIKTKNYNQTKKQINPNQTNIKYIWL